MEMSQKIDIRGIIMPNNWDENGRIIQIALYANNEDVYIVEHNSLTAELMHFMHQRVEIKGQIRGHPDGRKFLCAHTYRSLKEILNDE